MLRNEEQPVDEEEEEEEEEEEGRYTTVPSRGREEVGGYSVIPSMRRGREREEEQDQRRQKEEEEEQEEVEEETYSSSVPTLRRGQMRYHRLHQFSRLPPVPERYVDYLKQAKYPNDGSEAPRFTFPTSGPAWRTESCRQCQTSSPPPPRSSHQPRRQHRLHLRRPPADRPSPPHTDQGAGAGRPHRGRGRWRLTRRRTWWRGGLALGREDQAPLWEGGGAGFLNQDTKEGEGSAGGKQIDIPCKPWKTLSSQVSK